MFIGRDAELRYLEHYFEGNESRIIVVYGQKGVGKTTLLKYFTKDKNHAYYLGRSCSALEQRAQWAAELKWKGMDISKYAEYQELFKNALSFSNENKPVLLIDEFHYLVKTDDSFMPMLLQFIREYSKGILVVLCTSASGWVENNMVGKLGGLSAAISGMLKVRELKFADMRKVYSEYSFDDCVKLYAMLGGIPGLWNCCSRALSAKENMIQMVVNRYSRLFEEMSMFLAEELREPAVYNTLLTIMAKGGNKLNDMYEHTGFSRAKISVYLKNLMELDLVEKVFSYETAGYDNTQKGIYRISNSYVRFYFRFLFPYQSIMQDMEPETFYEKFIQDYYPDFVEEAYRKICREYFQQGYSYVGEWLGKTGSIDIVTCDKKGHTTVVFCSYAKEITYEDYEWLKFQVGKAKINADTYLFIGEKGFHERLEREALDGKVQLMCLA